jgi:predicted ribosomally synthesized peptide with SipW-like signal peptide
MHNRLKKVALSVSLLLVVAWCVLGTGASLAWFTDTDEEVKNIFHFAEFDLEVSHRLEDGTWEKVEQGTKLFDDEALYEPGYVQVVYLRIENKGEVPFDWKTAVTVTDYTEPTNIFGQKFHLQDYLKFGLATAETEEKLFELVATRDLAEEVANMPLNHYYENDYTTDASELGAQEMTYLALIVRMPENVTNIANYRGDIIPRVELGVIVSATQKTD